MLNELESITVLPTDEDLRLAWCYAAKRRKASAGYNDRQVDQSTPLQVDMVGCLCEMMACCWLGIPYHFHVGTFRKPDLPWDIEVRGTTWITGHCKVRPDDNDCRKVVMGIAIIRPATSSVPTMVRFPGWILASEGKRHPIRDPYGERMPFHFVPQEALRPMSELKTIIQIEEP